MRRLWLWLTGILVTLMLGVVALSFFIDEPLRKYTERQLNAQLQGYTARVGVLDFHPLGFSLDLKDVVIVQNAHPEPAVAHLPRLSASVQWRALLSARVVADFVFDHPKIYINRRQTKKEAEDKVPVQERGWQAALQSIYPLKINELRVIEGDLTYVDEGPFRPLHLSRLNFRAGNIRNIWSPEHNYPSDLHLDGVIFDSGTLLLDGHANFLAEPHPGVQAQVTLENIELDYFKPILARQNCAIRGGTFSGTGTIEYAPGTQVVDLQQLTIQDVQIDYIHTARSVVAEKKAARETVQAAQKVSNQPTIFLRIKHAEIIRSTVGFENKATDPPYRLFISHADLRLTNLSNHLTEGTSVGKLSGKLMGSGTVQVTTTFRPETKGPDFDLAVRIEPTPMQPMNDLWRAYGNFDVTAGLFSLNMEFGVKSSTVTGYVKPFFENLDVYDRRQDKEEGVLQQIYEGLIGGISWLLENPSRDEVATKTTVSGRLENPEAGTWEAVVGLIQNAFFRAILPGFEREAGRAGD
jgi:hypothetical protein